MSERVYSWLLRLFPARFRETYGDDALQLFRDRWRDETGFLPRLRLCLDLLADFSISFSRMQRFRQSPLAGASAPAGGAPSFHVLEDEAMHPGAVLFGAALSLAVFGGCSYLFNQAVNYRPVFPADLAVAGAFPRGRLYQPAAQQPSPRGAPFLAMAEELKLDAAERKHVIDAARATIEQNYVDPDVARKMSEALLAHEKNGDYNAITDGAAFADLLSRQLRDVGHDQRIDVLYSPAPLPDRPPGPTPESLARYRKAMQQQNCTFEKVEILPHNIGYLKLNSFPEPSICGATAASAMASLNHAEAIIFDLRDNGGGYPSMVMLMAAYLFDHPEYMYNPRENTTEQLWTQSPVPGNRLADKPVYILTSASTISGAEHFSYDLKMLKRATIVGETTGGAAHAGVFHRMDAHFGIGIPETKAINPFSKTDWAVTGVEPDVKVEAADALERAEKLAQSKLQSKLKKK
jgi:Peptidase family S41/N-terminal domain of Peptidase_S41 in eukaryotic IRBP